MTRGRVKPRILDEFHTNRASGIGLCEVVRSRRQIQDVKAPAFPAPEPVEAVAVMMAERSALVLSRHVARIIERLAKQAKRDPEGALRHGRIMLSVVKIAARLWRW